MNYQAIYDRLMVKAKDRVLVCYSEKHHVVPRCMGGTDDIENLVQLTPEEHFVAHQLLLKLNPFHRGLAFAVNVMTGNSKLPRSNKLYGWLRKRLSQTQRGKKLSASHIASLKRARQGRVITLETREKTSASLKGNQNGLGWRPTHKQRQKQVAALKGRPKPKVTCPHCGITGGVSAMMRFHFDRCKCA